MSALVCDTGPLVAVLNERDKYHDASVALFDEFNGDLVVPSLIVTEVCYLAQTQIGPHAETRFLDSIVEGELIIEELTAADWQRVAALAHQYAGFPLGAADASVIAVAERLGVKRIASIDHRHMHAVRPVHCDGLELLP
ncbi:type II toxin-antitoxin system VapC family toxin [Nocardia sp. CA-290969]|uniref:type II toxin-antitoxin system VapC family toxin n=1 Tax=Nocardia sp. CA-290969 TaxID=3239986 RepID=UPI003D90C713